MSVVLHRSGPRRPPARAPVPIDPSELPGLSLWTPATGATGGGSTAYASAASQYHYVADKPALRTAATGIGIIGQFSLTSIGTEQGIAGKCGDTYGAAGLEYALEYLAGPGRCRFSVSNGTTLVSVEGNLPGVPTPGVWYTVAAWYDPAGGGSLNLCVNDGTIAGITCPITPQAAGGEFRVGRVGEYFFNGRARGVAVLRRPPTASERTALHAGGTGVTYNDAPETLKEPWALGGWWDLAILHAGQRAADMVRRPNLAPRAPTATTRGTTAPPAGFAAYRTFTQAATSYLGGVPATVPSSCPGYPGEINRFGPAVTLRLRVRRADTNARDQSLWRNTANAIGLTLYNNQLAWYVGGPTYRHGTGPTLAAGVWYDVGVSLPADKRVILVVDGVVVHSFYYATSAQTLDTIGGQTTTNGNTLNGDLCGAEQYADALSAAEWAALHAGTPAASLPVMAYRMDETADLFEDYGRTGADLTASGLPTPADPPVLVPKLNGHPVRRLLDLSGGARHLTAPADQPADYATDSKRLPLLGMTRGVRCDQQGPKRLAAAAVLGTVTEFTFAVAGLLSHPIDEGGLALGGQARVCPIVGCSNNGTYGTAAGDAWAILGYQEGRSGNSEQFWRFTAAVRAAGGPTVEVFGEQPHPFGHTLTCRYKGGQYLALALNGHEIGRVTTGVPASLALTGDFTWGKVAGFYASGHQLHDLVVCNQAITDAQVHRLHAYWAQQMQIVPVRSGIAFDAGPWNLTDPEGFSQMAGMVACDNGEILLTFCNGINDPQVETGKLILQRSPSGGPGMSWDPGEIVVDERPISATSGESLFRLHVSVGARLSGDIGLVYSLEEWDGAGFPPGSINTYVKWSRDHGHSWTAPTAIPTPGGYLNMAQYGRPLQRPSGDLWVPAYAETTPGTWHSVIMRSADGGATWSLTHDMITETGGMATEMELLMFDALGAPDEGIALARGGGCLQQSRTVDGGATWDQVTNPDGPGTSTSYQNTTPNLLLDDQNRLIGITGQRNVFYAADGKVVRNGLRLQVSLDRGRTWGPIVMLFDNRGRTNNGAWVDGPDLITASVDETGKIRWFRFPAAALPDVTTP